MFARTRVSLMREVSGPLGKFTREQPHEFLPGFRLEGKVGDALLADGGTAFRAHLAATERAGPVCGIDLHRIGQGEQFGVQAVVQQAGELLWGVIGREVGTSHVADEQGIAGEDGPGLGRPFGVGYENRNTLRRVARRFQEAQDAVAEADFVAIAHRDVRKFGARPSSEVDGGAGQRSEFGMAGNEIGVQVGLDHMLDAEAVLDCVFDVDSHVPLWIDYRGDASGTDYI